jgi:sporulation protein YlmC with PRC-barrel domain
MKKQLIVGAAVASLLAGSALAQSTNNTTNSSENLNKTDSSGNLNKTDSSAMEKSNTSASTSRTTSTSGFAMASTASGPVKYQNSGSSELMTSKLVGTNVYNNENENIGEIKDIALEGSKVSGVVISVGGFLGMGTEYVLVDPASIALQNDNGTWKAHINSSKEDLKSAPKFTYNESKSNKG